MTSDEQPGRLKRMVQRLTADTNELDAQELTKSSSDVGATRMGDCQQRELVTVCGRVRSTTLRPRSGSPAVEADLWDGSGAVTLIWLGRRDVAGITPGRQLRATGRICMVDDQATIYNPRYELVSSDAS